MNSYSFQPGDVVRFLVIQQDSCFCFPRGKRNRRFHMQTCGFDVTAVDVRKGVLYQFKAIRVFKSCIYMEISFRITK